MEAKELLETIAKMSTEEREKLGDMVLDIVTVPLDEVPPIQVRFKKLTETAKRPIRAHEGDAGLDLYVDEVEVLDNYQVRYKSNIAFEIPKGYYGDLRARSSVCKKNQIMTNGYGTIDSNYRGSVDAVFYVTSLERDHYQVGDRFAQLIIMPYPAVTLVEAQELTTTDRGEGGYGSTGK